MPPSPTPPPHDNGRGSVLVPMSSRARAAPRNVKAVRAKDATPSAGNGATSLLSFVLQSQRDERRGVIQCGPHGGAVGPELVPQQHHQLDVSAIHFAQDSCLFPHDLGIVPQHRGIEVPCSCPPQLVTVGHRSKTYPATPGSLAHIAASEYVVGCSCGPPSCSRWPLRSASPR